MKKPRGSVIPLREIEEMQSIIGAATGKAASVRDAEKTYSLIGKVIRDDNMNTLPRLSDMIAVARGRLSPDILGRIVDYPEVSQARILFLLGCSEQQIAWEAQGGSLPEEAAAADQRRQAIENTSWLLQQALNAGESCMHQTEAAALRNLRDRLNQEVNEMPVIHVDRITGWQITRVISNANPADRPYILRHRIATTGKTGPKTAIFRAAVVRTLAVFIGDTSTAAKQFIADLFNDFHRDNPAVREITPSQVNHDLNDRL